MPVVPLHNEPELLQRTSRGDNDAFELLYRHYWSHVYTVALIISKSPESASDIAQEVFLDILLQRERLHTIGHFAGYLSTHTRFKILKRLRHQRTEEAYQSYLSGRVIHQLSDATEAGIDYNELTGLLHNGVEQLPPQQKEAFRLSREQGMTHEQIGEAMGISSKTVKNYLVKALAFLRQHFRDHGFILLPLALAELLKKYF